MRTFVLAAFAACALLASTARADDTKPPAINDVKASARGGQVHVEARITDETGVLSAIVHHRGAGGRVEDTPMVKNEFDDVFKASFPGGGDTEYWIEASDLLGNGPATYGSSSRAFTAGGKPGHGGGPAVASRETKREEPREERSAEPPPRRERHARRAPEPPVIQYQKPGVQPPEGKDFAVRMKIKSESPVAVAILQWRPQGGANTNTPLAHAGGDSYEGVIPAAQAKGTVEYFIAAKNQAGLMTRQGDGDAKTPYVLTFKPAGASSTAVAAGEKAAGPFLFSHLPLYRVPPGRPVLVRVQVTPAADNGELPDKVAVLWRGNDAQDQFTEMTADPTGGWGGYRAELPSPEEGAIFYQIVACDPTATRCGADTGSKRRWHSTMVSAQPGGAQPMPLDAVSSKAPPSLPE